MKEAYAARVYEEEKGGIDGGGEKESQSGTGEQTRESTLMWGMQNAGAKMR